MFHRLWLLLDVGAGAAQRGWPDDAARPEPTNPSRQAQLQVARAVRMPSCSALPGNDRHGDDIPHCPVAVSRFTDSTGWDAIRRGRRASLPEYGRVALRRSCSPVPHSTPCQPGVATHAAPEPRGDGCGSDEDRAGEAVGRKAAGAHGPVGAVWHGVRPGRAEASDQRHGRAGRHAAVVCVLRPGGPPRRARPGIHRSRGTSGSAPGRLVNRPMSRRRGVRKTAR